MQYYKPDGPYFVGDCMPLYTNDVFHLYYLLDENHHQGNGGLGGHQWAHASSPDLVHWVHHPLALGITEAWEGSICTGSVFYHEGQYHAFYATRRTDWTQHLNHAVSADGMRFTKEPEVIGFPPPGYSPFHYRDPFVYQDDQGAFQMLVTAQIDPYPLHDRGGCLLRLSSPDLHNWSPAGPLLIPGGEPGYGSIPECADLFFWNGWYYLLFGLRLQTHYRMAKDLSGPWLRPVIDTLDNSLLAVMKTAPFANNRRIGAGWVPCRKDQLDKGQPQWGGNVVFRELLQQPDGTLGTKFVTELLPAGEEPNAYPFTALKPGAGEVSTGQGFTVTIEALYSQEVGVLDNLPDHYRLRCQVAQHQPTARFGLGLRGSGPFGQHYQLAMEGILKRVSLEHEQIEGVDGLGMPFELDLIVQNDLIDACVGGQRCLINRLPEHRGSRLFFFAEYGSVTFSVIEIWPLGVGSQQEVVNE